MAAFAFQPATAPLGCILGRYCCLPVHDWRVRWPEASLGIPVEKKQTPRYTNRLDEASTSEYQIV